MKIQILTIRILNDISKRTEYFMKNTQVHRRIKLYIDTFSFLFSKNVNASVNKKSLADEICFIGIQRNDILMTNTQQKMINSN